MTIPTVTFFNPRSGVGKTSSVYHLSWTLAEMGRRVVVADLDPQCDLTTRFLDENTQAEVCAGGAGINSVYCAMAPLLTGDDHRPLAPKEIAPNLYLVPGDVALAALEETYAESWSAIARDASEPPNSQVMFTCRRVLQSAGARVNADLILVDSGPNLGALNRSALIASDYLVIPLGADFFSHQALKITGGFVRRTRELWRRHRACVKNPLGLFPDGLMQPIGYLAEPPRLDFDEDITVCDKWIRRMPSTYHKELLGTAYDATTPSEDPECLAMWKPFHSLTEIARHARKPVFHLTVADGAIGALSQGAVKTGVEYQRIAEKILQRIGHLPISV